MTVSRTSLLTRLIPSIGAILLVACERAGRGGRDFAIRDSAGVTIVEVGDPARLELAEWIVAASPSAVIGADDGEPGHDLFGVAGAAFLSDDRIVVANGGSQELRLFDPDGAFIGSVGGEGEGPGEFAALAWAGVTRGDTIVAYDWRSRRLSRFTRDGSFLSGVRVVPPHEGSFPEPRGVFANGELVFVPGFDRVFGEGERRDTIPFIRYDRAGRIRDTLAWSPGREEYFFRTDVVALRSDIPFGRDVLASAGPAAFAIGTNDAYEVSLIDPARGGVRTIVRASPDPRPVTAEEVRVWKEERLAGNPDEVREVFQAMYEELPVRATHPAFDGLAIDADGRVWVRTPPPPDESGVIWLVYTSEGTPAARVRMPSGLDVVAIGARHVLAVGRDELDREIVHVYAHDGFGGVSP